MSFDLASFGEWLQARSLRTTGKPLAGSTVRAKQGHIRQTMSTLELGSLPELAALLTERSTVEDILNHLYTKHAAGTVRLDVQALRDFAAYAIAKRWIERHYIEQGDTPRLPNRPDEIETFTQDEVNKLLLFAEVRGNLRFRFLLETVVGTGCRISELLALKWDGVLIEHETPHLRFADTKSGRPMRVPLNERLRTVVWTPENLAELRAIPQNVRTDKSPDEYVFPMSYNSAYQSLMLLCERAKIPFRSWHKFRHTYATRMLQRGVPIHAVSRLLNHSNVSITDRYYAHDSALDYAGYLDDDE